MGHNKIGPDTTGHIYRGLKQELNWIRISEIVVSQMALTVFSFNESIHDLHC